MGNYRFKLSNMMPNAWFYELKDMRTTRNHNTIHTTKKKQPPTSSSSSSTAPATGQPSKPKQPHISQPRKSYYFTREATPPQTSETTFYTNSPRNPKSSDTHFPDPPRKSSNKRHSTRRNRAFNITSPRLVNTSASEEYSNSPLESSSDLESLLPEFGSGSGVAMDSHSLDGMVSWSSSCHCRADKDIDGNSFNRKFDGFDTIADLDLRSIKINKPASLNDAINDKKKTKETTVPTTIRSSSANLNKRNKHGSVSIKVVKEDTISASKDQRTSPVHRFSVNSPGLKLRTNSPRIANRKIQAHGRRSLSSTSSSNSRSLSETLAIVKSSSDPLRDFRDSMVEMILENNIKASKDLVELLACYLSLNSDEYHEGEISRLSDERRFNCHDAQ
ncbi:hypothetical protein F0562_015143 [Nyssa sinensis]|uniref:Transcription repressor n=1 Tax=Nyssa sinensis TaxID=561372 RepID=A0A5J4ZHV8_9ASTE|nr:hypothetical protein F0562_015143 [Nyssa sinensis]